MNSLPLVSICVPVYGVEKYIERCARSLFAQSYSNIEYLFVNDCTKDASMDVLCEVLKNYPNRTKQVKIINHEKNLGLAGARNTGIMYASGDFVMWVDSDDYVDLELVEKCVNKQKDDDSDIVTAGALHIKKNHAIPFFEKTYPSIEKNVAAILARKAEVRVWGRLIRRQLYIDNHISVEVGANMGEDYQVIPLL